MRVLLPLQAIVLTACTAATERRASDEAALAEGRPVGQSIDCIETSRIFDTQIRSDSVIDFRMRGGEIYRNTLPASCSGLRFEDRFAYRTNHCPLKQWCRWPKLRPGLPSSQ